MAFNTRKIFLVRKLKGWFLWLRLHVIFGPLSTGLAYLAYMARFSKWRREHRDLPFNDFYNKRVRYTDRFQLHAFLVDNYGLNEPINYLEFGVATGVAIKWWLKHNKQEASRFTGFDVFTGLPEDWGLLKQGDFDQGGSVPDVEGDTRCSFVTGLFQKTLPSFIKDYDFGERTTVYHLDADLYSATLFVLTTLAPYFKKGDVLIFDEFGVPLHEFRAFEDFFGSYYLDYEVLGAVNNYLQVAVRLK